jgi:hypothetical protein
MPRCGVGARAMIFYCCAREYPFDPSPQARGCFASVLPNWPQHGENILCANVRDCHVTDYRVGECLKRLAPLLAVDFAAQTLKLFGHVRFGRLFERQARGGRNNNLLCFPRRLSVFDRIDSFCQ